MRTLHCQVPSRMRRACASQSGSTMLLGIGVGAVVLALILILATATAIYLDLKRLTYLADNCVALAAREVGSEGQLDALAAQKQPARAWHSKAVTLMALWLVRALAQLVLVV